MNRRDAVLTIPTAIAAVALKLKANPTPTGPVLQSELQEVIDLQNRVEVLVFGIRKRLEAGAGLEPGQLGCSAVTHMSLKDLAKCGIGDATQIDGYGILDIEPADRIRRERKRYPDFAHEFWVS